MTEPGETSHGEIQGETARQETSRSESSQRGIAQGGTSPRAGSRRAGAGRRGARKRVNYGEGREALLNAAIRVVARGGLRRLTYRAVAEEAGVTHGLVVHHFGSRDALVEEALAHAVRLSLSTGSLEPGTGKVEDFSVGLSQMVESGPDIQAFQYELLLESRRRPELLPQLRALYDEYFDATRRELSEMLGGASHGLSRMVFATLEGLVLHQLVFGEREVTESALDELRTVLRLLAADRERTDRERADGERHSRDDV